VVVSTWPWLFNDCVVQIPKSHGRKTILRSKSDFNSDSDSWDPKETESRIRQSQLFNKWKEVGRVKGERGRGHVMQMPHAIINAYREMLWTPPWGDCNNLYKCLRHLTRHLSPLGSPTFDSSALPELYYVPIYAERERLKDSYNSPQVTVQ